MARQPETLFKTRVLKKLNEIPCSFFIKTQMVALRGVPDILGVVRGRFVALELKTEDGVTDELQKWTLAKIAKAGGYARVVRPSNLDLVITQILSL